MNENSEDKDKMLENKSKKKICPLCRGSKEVLRQTKRTMGYTLTPGETIDEEIIPCPLCSDDK
jgi:hypothetical protein